MVVPTDERGDEPVEPGRLDERVLVALEGRPGRVAFSGLRRLLRAHPESLSRALHRLEREGLVTREDGGYRSLVARSSAPDGTAGEGRVVAQVDLPRTVDPSALRGRLAGRWFGQLRWLGSYSADGDELLVWARRDGAGTVALRARGATLRVLSHDRRGRDDPTEVEEAAYELLAHAVAALRSPLRPSTGAVAEFAWGRGADAAGPREN